MAVNKQFEIVSIAAVIGVMAPNWQAEEHERVKVPEFAKVMSW